MIAAGDRLVAGIKRQFPTAEAGSVSTVSAKVSGELFRTGMTALIAAMIAISIYIWIRFEWQFGVGAIWSLLHDVTLTFGLFALTGWEFDLNIIAALLTIIGYSLNDTVVVYDRIRENLMKIVFLLLSEEGFQGFAPVCVHRNRAAGGRCRGHGRSR